jgi:hypothetical protein
MNRLIPNFLPPNARHRQLFARICPGHNSPMLLAIGDLLFAPRSLLITSCSLFALCPAFPASIAGAAFLCYSNAKTTILRIGQQRRNEVAGKAHVL